MTAPKQERRIAPVPARWVEAFGEAELVLDGVDLLAPNRPGSLGVTGFIVASAGSTVEITRSPP